MNRVAELLCAELGCLTTAEELARRARVNTDDIFGSTPGIAPTRKRMARLLRRHGATVAELAGAFGTTETAARGLLCDPLPKRKAGRSATRRAA